MLSRCCAGSAGCCWLRREGGGAKRLGRSRERATGAGAGAGTGTTTAAGCCSWTGCGATGGSGSGSGCGTGAAGWVARPGRAAPPDDEAAARAGGLNDGRAPERAAEPDARCRGRRAGGQRGEELRHARVVLRDALLEQKLEARLLGHPVVHLRAGVADHVADHDADDEAAEDRREAVAARDRPDEAQRAEGHRADEDTSRRADSNTEPPDRTCLCLVVPDELFDGSL